MTRKIDTMTEEEVKNNIVTMYLCQEGMNCKEELEKLFQSAPHWSDNLDLNDDQTWVFCFVSDDSLEDTRYAEWIAEVLDDGYRGPEGLVWTHATPVDLNVRYKEVTQ